MVLLRTVPFRRYSLLHPRVLTCQLYITFHMHQHSRFISPASLRFLAEFVNCKVPKIQILLLCVHNVMLHKHSICLKTLQKKKASVFPNT